MRKLISCLALFTVILLGCSKENLFSESVRHNLWLFHKGAELPVVVEGNTNSKVFLLVLHGGPGGSAQEFNTFTEPFTDLLEEKYATVYYDQRNAGLARGEWSEDLFTIEQHIEDLGKVIDLLTFKFGSDIKIFLAGHSWGGYLGTANLLTDNNQENVVSWINIDGQINRNTRNHEMLERISEIANEQILQNSFPEEWTDILEDLKKEQELNITQYDISSESAPIALMVRCENLIFKSGLMNLNVNSSFESIFSNNYHPFIALANNKSNKPLINEMYNSFDGFIAENLNSLVLPTISIYGKYDVRTPKQQGENLLDKIGTRPEYKKIVILDNSGHSTMRNEPIRLANEIIDWIERYR